MQHPTVCSSRVPRQHVRGAVFASTDAIFGVFVPQEHVATSSSAERHYVTGKTAKGSALPAFHPHPPTFVSQLTELRKPLPSVLQVSFSDHRCFGPPCRALTHIRAPGTPAVLLRGCLSFSLASQTQLGWQNNVFGTAPPLLRDVTMRILCWADFCHFGGWGWKAALLHCHCLDIVLRASMGRNCF